MEAVTGAIDMKLITVLRTVGAALALAIAQYSVAPALAETLYVEGEGGVPNKVIAILKHHMLTITLLKKKTVWPFIKPLVLKLLLKMVGQYYKMSLY